MSSTTPGPNPQVSAGQRGSTSPCFQIQNGGSNFMSWIGASGYTWVNFAVSSTLVFSNAVYATSRTSNFPPALVLGPADNQGMIFWSDSVLRYVQINQSSSGSWQFNTSLESSITGSQPTGGPSADLKLIGGQLYYVVAWQDGKTQSISWAAIPCTPGSGTPSTITALSASCKGSPVIEACGLSNILLWTNTDGTLKMAYDPQGGFNFNISSAVTLSGASSLYGPSLTLMPDLKNGYVAWNDSQKGLCLSTITMGLDGVWRFNGGITPISITNGMVGGPSINTIQVTDPTSGAVSTALSLGWTDNTSTNTIQTMQYNLI
ncbi:MAG: hypothetical protein HQL76_05445 [Magnetococcales bacterium]|nr:hypothetical protein [Magnetococcales bacterium]